MVKALPGSARTTLHNMAVIASRLSCIDGYPDLSAMFLELPLVSDLRASLFPAGSSEKCSPRAVVSPVA